MEKNIFIGFLWSPGTDLWDTILSEINETHKVQNKVMYDFNDEYNIFERCVLDIYKTDDIAIETVQNIKLNAMRNFSNTFMMFYIKIDNPDYRQKGNGNNISRSVEAIKYQIREKYKSKVKNYEYDIIIHLADNDVQTKFIEDFMPSYENYKKKLDL